jgi:hypothetical protein
MSDIAGIYIDVDAYLCLFPKVGIRNLSLQLPNIEDNQIYWD